MGELQAPITAIYAALQALLAIGYRPVPLAGSADQKVVDIGIQRTLDALLARDDDVLLVSHDADFVDHLERLAEGRRRVGIIGLREYASIQYDARGIELHDLEDEVGAFNVPLPRVRIIPLDQFDPESFLR